MKPGDKITIVFRHGVVLTETREYRKDELSKSTAEQPIWSFSPSADALQDRVRFDEEDVRWLRGHHLPDSKEVAAARVAQALAVQPARVVPAQTGLPPFAKAVLSIGTRMLDLIIKTEHGEKP